MEREILHKRSQITINNNPKVPSPENMEYGEIAINYAKDNETIFIKNNNNEIVDFKPKKYHEEMLSSKIFIGTQEEYNIAYLGNKISTGALVIILENGELESDTLSILGTSILGKMILGKQ